MDNPPESLSEAAYKKWIKNLNLNSSQMETLTKNIDKTMKWWKDQPEQAVCTIHRVFVAMDIEATKAKPDIVNEVILKIMTAAMTCAT